MSDPVMQLNGTRRDLFRAGDQVIIHVPSMGGWVPGVIEILGTTSANVGTVSRGTLWRTYEEMRTEEEHAAVLLST